MKNLSLYALLALSLAACAEKSGVTSGECSSEVLNAHRSVSSTCQSFQRYPSAYLLESCKSEIDKFLRAYPDANCEARRLGTGELVRLRSSELADVRRRLDEAAAN